MKIFGCQLVGVFVYLFTFGSMGFEIEAQINGKTLPLAGLLGWGGESLLFRLEPKE